MRRFPWCFQLLTYCQRIPYVCSIVPYLDNHKNLFLGNPSDKVYDTRRTPFPYSLDCLQKTSCPDGILAGSEVAVVATFWLIKLRMHLIKILLKITPDSSC